jgi:GNAT superfamily N-acetyltransferase
MNKVDIITITPDNIEEEGIFCLKNPQHPGFKCKADWYREHFAEGLRMKIAKDEGGLPAGFVEYVPAEYAWRPVTAPGYMFIHCLWVYPKKAQSKGFGSALIRACEDDARAQGKAGIVVMVSRGAWMAEVGVFLRNGFQRVEQKGRFELLAKKFSPSATDPQLIDWIAGNGAYKGWHLVYADQCPLHEKSARDLLEEAKAQGIQLNVKRIDSAAEARQIPSGYGVYGLIHDGVVQQDHYVSRARFRNILKGV